jgi:7-cyano-7-deazaguanine synthase in queuosine biosynthesis
MQRLLLYSGGIDSFIAYHFLSYPQTIYFGIGHKYEYKEIHAIEKTIPQTKIDQSMLHLGKIEQPDANIPMRNLFLLAAAASYIQSKEAVIYLIVQKGEMEIPDRTNDFLSRASIMLTSLCERKIEVQSPFVELTKTMMVKWYVDKGFPIDALKNTHACYTPTIDRTPCYACAACFRRWVALFNNGISEEGADNMIYWEGILSYIDRIADGKYDLHRAGETLKAIRTAVGILDGMNEPVGKIREKLIEKGLMKNDKNTP